MPRPTIGMLHYTCPPIVGGVESVIAATTSLFADAGYPVQVFAGRGRQFDQRIPVTIVPELDSKHPALLAVNEELDRGRIGDGFQQLSRTLESCLQELFTDIDVCIVHNALSLHFNLPLTAALHRLLSSGHAPRVIAWCHDLSWSNPLYLPKMRAEPPWSLLKQPLPGVAYVVVSHERRRELADLFDLDANLIHLISNGVDPARFFNLTPLAARIASENDLFAQDLVLLLPARITARKNIELAIHVVGSLVRRGLKTRLVVTGPPGPHNIRSVDYVDVLQSLRAQLGLAEEVVFLYEMATGEDGTYAVDDHVIRDLYAIGDLLFFPSYQEGFGIPILEAGLARLPVFCSDIPPFKEVGLGDVYFFSLQQSPDEIAASIAAFVQEDTAYGLRRRVLRDYTWPAIFDEKIAPLVADVAPHTLPEPTHPAEAGAHHVISPSLRGRSSEDSNPVSHSQQGPRGEDASPLSLSQKGEGEGEGSPDHQPPTPTRQVRP
ncbi:MAG: glycosyltransferase [Chloroflexi bacterium]|nr:glycosyltransferase [Chloroflexota bacterium]